MYQQPVTEQTSEAHARARKEAAQRMASHTTLTLKTKTPPTAAPSTRDLAEFRRDAPLRG